MISHRNYVFHIGKPFISEFPTSENLHIGNFSDRKFRFFETSFPDRQNYVFHNLSLPQMSIDFISVSSQTTLALQFIKHTYNTVRLGT